jgi:hypothetical protein
MSFNLGSRAARLARRARPHLPHAGRRCGTVQPLTIHGFIGGQSCAVEQRGEVTMARKFPVDTRNLKTIDALQTGTVWVLKDLPKEAFFTIGTIATDWDGDPKAYGDKRKHKEISPHDHLGNAGHDGSWWGVVTNTRHKTGTPIEQSGIGPAQPFKNYMISTTKLVDTAYPEDDVRRWTDATKIPYVALPNSRRSMVKIGLKTGCYCLLVNLQTMKFCFGAYADSKAATPRMGEISKRGRSDRKTGWLRFHSRVSCIRSRPGPDPR